MSRWTRALGVTAAVAAAAAVAVATGTAAWRRATGRRVAELLEGAAARRGGPATEAAPTPSPHLPGADLPTPVARYLAFALPDGAPRIRTARIRWAGEFRLRPDGGWSAFEATQHFTVRPPGFVWDATIRMLPLVPVRVRDGYVAGRGTMLGRVGGVVTVVDEGGTPGMAAGALARWLGEAVWLPTALLPDAATGDGVRWTAVDDTTARATVTDGATAVSADFHFAPGGEITRMTAMRHRDVDGASVPTPFEGRYAGYARHDGVMIPTSAEVAWLLPEGRFAYWRGRPVEVAYEAHEATDDRSPR